MPLHLGIVTGELFDLSLGRRGGFGKIAQTVAGCFNTHPGLGVSAVFLHAFLEAELKDSLTYSGSSRVLLRPITRRSRLHDLSTYWKLLRSEHIDALLAIDYVSSYRRTFFALPRAPSIIWVQDPRTPSDWAKIHTLRIPGDTGRPLGIQRHDCGSLRAVFRWTRVTRRPLMVAVPDAFLAEKIPEVYGITPRVVSILPVPLDVHDMPIVKSKHPRAVYLGRLDPIKRPWIFIELAKQLPQVEFVVLGHAHYHGPGGWSPTVVPNNVRLLGHLDGAEKWRVISSAWALVNTSIHEALPVSFLEALTSETPIVSCQNPGGLVARFGAYVGHWDGDGLDGLQAFADGLMKVIDDVDFRTRSGREGRAWVTSTHGTAEFLRAFFGLLHELHTHRPEPPSIAGEVAKLRRAAGTYRLGT